VLSLIQHLNRLLQLVRKFVIQNDIPAAIKGNANYLTALGGLYCGDLSRKKTKLSQNYISFIKDFFHPDYMKINNDLENGNLKGLYGVVRS
jgi:hypothetical protein